MGKINKKWGNYLEVGELTNGKIKKMSLFFKKCGN